MVWRRLALFFVLLIVVGVIADAIAPREKASPPPTLPPVTPAAPASDIVRGRLPGTGHVVAHVGDVVQLDVSHDAQDVVQISSLGVEEPVERDIDAQLVFDADRAGRFAVTLRDTGKRLGTVEIKQPG